MKRLYRAKYDKMILGVFGGIGRYLSIDPTILRLFAIFLCIMTGILPLVIGYLLVAIIIPIESQKYPIRGNYKKLYREKKDRKIAGICAGIAKILKLDPIIVRVIFIVLLFITGVVPLLIAYIVGWAVIPENVKQ